MQLAKGVLTSSNSRGPEVQPATELGDVLLSVFGDVLLSVFEAWENLPFLHKPLQLEAPSTHPFHQWKGLCEPSVICLCPNQPGLAANGVEKVNLVYVS